jgi:hypothetical protein
MQSPNRFLASNNQFAIFAYLWQILGEILFYGTGGLYAKYSLEDSGDELSVF